MNISPQQFTSTFSIGRPMIGLMRSLSFLCISLTYGFVLSQLPDANFMDFDNYLEYAKSSLLTGSVFQYSSLLSILSNEPVWTLLNAGLGLFWEPEQVLRCIIFLGASSFAWLILVHYPRQYIFLIMFLLLPQVIKNYLIHLRQGAAIAVFLWGWFSVNRYLRLLLMGLTPLIHSSFFFILVLFVFTKIIQSLRFAFDLKTIAFIAAGILTGLSMSTLAELLGARQAGQYAFERADVSGIGFFIWLAILLIMLSARSNWLRYHAFETGIVSFYLATYWLVEVTARIFEDGLILILLAGLTLRGWRRHVFFGIVFGTGVFEWLSRISRPSFGFATS